MLQNKPAFIQSIFGKNYGHLELSFYLKTLWKQDTAPKHFEPFETWNEIHLNQPQTSALWLCASEPHVPLSLERNTHLDSAVQLQDPLQAEKKSTSEVPILFLLNPKDTYKHCSEAPPKVLGEMLSSASKYFFLTFLKVH